MSVAKSKIDAYVIKQKHKKFRLYSVVFFLLVISIMALVAYSTGVTSEVGGTVKGIHSTASESGESFNIVVELESSNIIYVKMPREAYVKKGDTVKLLQRETNLFGITNYIFSNVEK